jgi:predicted enzyme related to lactoylglutathione lyase
VPHSVSHFEINAQDAPATQRFYSELFGWGIDTNNPQNYGMIDTKAGRGIGGGIGPTQNGRSWVTFYVDTDDPVATLAKAERLGGRTVMPPMDAGTVTYALFADPEGNVIGLAKMQEQAQRPTRSQNGGTARARSATRAKTGAKNAKKKTTARGRTATTTRARSRTKRSRG